MAFNPNDTGTLYQIISSIQKHCVRIKSWVTASILQVNKGKTEVFVLMNKKIRNSISMNKIKIDSIDIFTSNSVKGLNALNSEVAAKIRTYMMSRINSFNCLLYGNLDKLWNVIQLASNYAARWSSDWINVATSLTALATPHWHLVVRHIGAENHSPDKNLCSKWLFGSDSSHITTLANMTFKQIFTCKFFINYVSLLFTEQEK